jgi:glycosyltransferase involved in cell wall biosynthesis
MCDKTQPCTIGFQNSHAKQKTIGTMLSNFRNPHGQNPSGRIFVDASHTSASGKNSGIERVVRSIVAECKQSPARAGMSAPEIVTFHSNRFYPITDRVQSHFSKLAALQSSLQSNLPNSYVRIAKWICKLAGSSRLQQWMLPVDGHLGAFKLPHNIYNASVRQLLPLESQPIAPTDNDIFLLPDAYWAKRGVWKAVANVRKSGATIATLIYDLIPLTHPQYVGTKRMEGFRRYLHQVIENSDVIVAISRAVQEDVQAYIRDHRSEFNRVPRDVKYFTLGAELKLVQGEVRPEIVKLFGTDSSTDNKPYMMVATFDPRKNHHYLLDAFDLLWQKNSKLRLCLIGRVGTLCEDVIQRIHQHPALNQQLFAFYDIKDAELQHCYQHCRGVVFPSTVEGFGLPIVESLWYGKRTFASNTPIHLEVGGEDCVYFELDSPASLAREIEKWEQIADHPNSRLPTRRPTTWQESCQQLIGLCLDSHRSLRSDDESSSLRAA